MNIVTKSFSFFYYSDDDFSLFDDVYLDNENNVHCETFLRLIPREENPSCMAMKIGGFDLG